MRRPEYWVLGFVIFLAVGRDFLANGRPLYCRIQEETHFPGLRTLVRNPQRPYGHPVLDSIQKFNLWRSYPYQAAVFAPIPFSPGEMPGRVMKPLANPGTTLEEGAGTYRHWLGTDDQGRDIAAGMVSGARIALQIGSLAVLISLCIGVFFGAIAGFWGDDRLFVRRGRLWLTLAALPIAWFWAFTTNRWIPESEKTAAFFLQNIGVFFAIIGLFNLLGGWLSGWPFFEKAVCLPVDLMVMRTIEVFTSIPRLVFIIAVAAVTPAGQSLWLMVALIGVLSWTGPARFIRGELLRIRSLDYIIAVRGLGLSEIRILINHALPNAMQPLWIQLAFSMGTAMLLEASVSFLGYGGVSFEGKSWGSLLLSARQHTTAWWMAIPPGVALFSVVFSLNLITERWTERR